MRLLVAAALVLTFPATASAAGSGASASFDTGSALLAVGTDDGRPSVTATPSRGLRVDGTAARIVVPAGLPKAWDFLGEPGAERFQLPGAGAPGLPDLSLSAGPGVAGASTLTVDVAGPGHVTAFTGGGADDLVRVVDTAARTRSVISLQPGETVRPTWIFSEPGPYRFSVTASTGGVSSAPSSYDLDVVAAAAAEPCFAADVPADAITVDDGHLDFGVQVADGRLISRIKDDRADPPVWRDPASTIFRIDDSSALPVPDSPTFSFLGAPGATVWGMGQTQEDGVPWLGWNTQHPSAITGIDGSTGWTLDAVEGPGDLFVYQTGSFGELTRIFGTGADWPRGITIPANVHAHANWSFTRPGVYRVTTTHSAKLSTGAATTSQETLTFLVGPCASAPAKPAADLPSSSLLADAALTESNRGGVTAQPSTVEAGDTVTMTVPGSAEGSWHMPVFYSTPQQGTWKATTADSTLAAVPVPSLSAGAHKVAAYDAVGALVGWAPLTVTAGAAPPPPPAPTPTPAVTPVPTPGPAPAPRETPDGVGAPSSPDATPAPDGTTVPGASVPGAAGGSSSSAQVCKPSSSAGGPGGSGADNGSGGSGSGSGNGSGSGSGGAGGDGGGSGGSAAASSVSTGHFDFGSNIVAGQLVPKVKDDRTQPPTWVDPSSLSFALGAKAQQKVPNGSAYSFLGAPGSPVWVMPQTQVDGVPWLGWNTQDESVRSNVKGSVTFRLDSVSGPGKLGVYLTDSFGGVGEKQFGNLPGFSSSFSVPLNVHAHGNWAFTAPGTYQVTITQSATLTSGAKVSAPATLTFTVGGAPTGSSSVGPASFRIAAAAPIAAVPTPTAPAATPRATCTLPEAGAPDVRLFVGAGLLLLVAGVVMSTASLRSRRTAG
jgi:putative ABC transporter-associated repeat protein